MKAYILFYLVSSLVSSFLSEFRLLADYQEKHKMSDELKIRLDRTINVTCSWLRSKSI